MREKRAKAYRRQFSILRHTYNFTPPIQLLVDASTILEAQKHDYPLIRSLESAVQLPIKLFISQCCINRLYESKDENAIDLSKKMNKRHCHHKETLVSHECIESLVNVDGENVNRYAVVSQSKRLRQALRTIPAVPLFHLKNNVLVMEPLSKVTKKMAEIVEQRKRVEGLNNIHAGKRNKEDNSTDDDDSKRKKRKVKGVNPLSMKKKIVKEQQNLKTKEEVQEQEKKKRKRRHKKSVQNEETNENDRQEHVQEQLVEEEQMEEQAMVTPISE